MEHLYNSPFNVHLLTKFLIIALQGESCLEQKCFCRCAVHRGIVLHGSRRSRHWTQELQLPAKLKLRHNIWTTKLTCFHIFVTPSSRWNQSVFFNKSKIEFLPEITLFSILVSGLTNPRVDDLWWSAALHSFSLEAIHSYIPTVSLKDNSHKLQMVIQSNMWNVIITLNQV